MDKKLSFLLSLFLIFSNLSFSQIVQDAEYYIIEAQNKQVWEVEDQEIDSKLAELRDKYGTPPNIIHFMWDDQPVMAIGDPLYQKMRGYETPNLNKLSEEGMLFARMYAENGCTPSRCAALTGQHPVRNGVYEIGFPVEYRGLAAENVTIAEVLSQAGYSTAFYGKLHMGDVEQTYPTNQGFDEAFWAVYNQVFSLWTAQGEQANAVIGLFEEILVDDPYQLDNTFVQKGYVGYLEGKKGELVKEWGSSRTLEDYDKFDFEAKKRAFNFIRKNAEGKNPFFLAWWPQWISFVPNQPKTSLQRGLVGDGYQNNLDPTVGELISLLHELGIAENTLIVAMADNGPMVHDPPPGLGMGAGLFRGGKGDITEGGVRVCAAAWWPGMIEGGQIAGDIIHITDLYTTFARLGGATQYIPSNRITDGIDQTSLLLNGDTYSRRDYVFIYSGPTLAATVKKQYKKHWFGGDPLAAASGIAAQYYDLYNDPQEISPILVGSLHMKEPFNRMRARHDAWIDVYPHIEEAIGPAYTGISNARPETLELSKPPEALKNLPFDVLDYINHLEGLPYDPTDPDFGQ